jgi:hypothetical protein
MIIPMLFLFVLNIVIYRWSQLRAIPALYCCFCGTPHPYITCCIYQSPASFPPCRSSYTHWLKISPATGPPVVAAGHTQDQNIFNMLSFSKDPLIKYTFKLYIDVTFTNPIHILKYFSYLRPVGKSEINTCKAYNISKSHAEKEGKKTNPKEA